jgi:hypothetical protein
MGFLDWWVPDDEAARLVPGEREVVRTLANQTVSAWRAIGGELVVTDRRVMFRPNRVDAALGGRVWVVPLAEVVDVGKKRPNLAPFSGGLRSRLRLRTRDGAEHLFVVNRLDDVVARIVASPR